MKNKNWEGKFEIVVDGNLVALMGGTHMSTKLTGGITEELNNQRYKASNEIKTFIKENFIAKDEVREVVGSVKITTTITEQQKWEDNFWAGIEFTEKDIIKKLKL